MTKEPAGRAPRRRTAQESLGAIVLGFELVVVFLGTLVVFGLHAVPPAVAFLGGGAVLLLMIAAVLLLRYRVGYWLGWLAQLLVVAAGFLVGMLFIVGAIFTAIWAYAMIMGARLDRQNALARQATSANETSNDDPDTTLKEKP